MRSSLSKAEDDDAHPRVCRPNLAQGFHPVQFRHLQIEQDHIRVQLRGAMHGLSAGRRFTHDLKIRLGAKHSREAVTDDRVIVCDKNMNRDSHNFVETTRWVVSLRPDRLPPLGDVPSERLYIHKSAGLSLSNSHLTGLVTIYWRIFLSDSLFRMI